MLVRLLREMLIYVSVKNVSSASEVTTLWRYRSLIIIIFLDPQY